MIEVHDLHVWQITSGQPSLSAHVLVADDADSRMVRSHIETVLHDEFGLEHTTLQVDHTVADGDNGGEHCAGPHGPVHRP
ncbi:cation efflux family protein [Mycobacterium xenopi 4042]|uniref:Cation efflux family protein n=1 Tax=Mycobacterium xenopi 4042 TaxID=1299334 RepID=X8BD32_MYCXE|nr:cation efflux family protein [Mycobacterium xenopi 4042]